MALPDEERARAELARQFADLFARAERVHNAAVETLTRGKLVVTKPIGANKGVVFLIASLLTKACKTFRAIQLAAEGGLGQDASVLARQLFETSVAVAFILKADTKIRAAMFAAHEDQRLLVLVEKASEVNGLENIGSAEMLEKARQKVRAWEELIPKEVVDSVRRHWSGKTLEWAAKEVDLVSAYALMYRSTSAFAHGSDANAHFFVRPGDEAPTLKLSPGDDQVQAVLVGSIVLMRIIFGAANEAFGLGEDAVIERISAEMPSHESTPGG